jgi:hypothetical protein
MDFIAFYTLMGAIFTSIVFSYDIACQWFRNMKKRMHQLSHEMWIPPPGFWGASIFYSEASYLWARGKVPV